MSTTIRPTRTRATRRRAEPASEGARLTLVAGDLDQVTLASDLAVARWLWRLRLLLEA